MGRLDAHFDRKIDRTRDRSAGLGKHTGCRVKGREAKRPFTIKKKNIRKRERKRDRFSRARNTKRKP